MHLARVGAGVRVLAPGVPQMFPIDPQEVVRTAVEGTFAYILAPESNGNSKKARSTKSRSTKARSAS
jgi:hypothetical protein